MTDTTDRHTADHARGFIGMVAGLAQSSCLDGPALGVSEVDRPARRDPQPSAVKGIASETAQQLVFLAPRHLRSPSPSARCAKAATTSA